MILKIIISLGALFAIFWTIKTKKIIPAIITFGMIAGIIMVLFPHGMLQKQGFLVYMIFVNFVIIYGLAVKGKNFWERLTICLISISILAYWLWVLNHWHGNVIIFPIFALLVGVVGVFKKVNLRDELGFMIILIVDAIAIMLEIIMKLQ